MAIEGLERRRLLSGQTFPGLGLRAAGFADKAVTADFNGDGKLDIAAIEPSVASIAISLGDGAGGFMKLPDFSSQFLLNSRSLTNADLNSDGRADLLVTCDKGVFTLLGTASGALTLNDYQPLSYPSGIVVADFNGDGRTDYAVTLPYDTKFLAVLGNGDGTFGIPIASDISITSADNIVAGDFNGDGKMDVATASYSGAAGITLFAGRGDGTFAAGTTVLTSVSDRPNLAAGDLNGDGKLDLVTNDYAGNAVRVLLGNGSGSFTALTIEAGVHPIAIAIGNLNADTKPDLAITTGDGQVLVRLGTGTGTFVPGKSVTVGQSPYSVSIADMNGDAKNDLVVASRSSQTVSVVLGNGDGTFVVPATLAAGSKPVALVSADFNNDRRADLVVANSGSNTLSVLLGTGNGGFTPAADVAVGASPAKVITADFNRDGIPDLAVVYGSASNALWVLLGRGDGTFALSANVAVGTNPTGLAVADFNRDGKTDLATANDATDGGIRLLLGNGNGTFATPVVVSAVANLNAIVTGDFNNDGKADLAATARVGQTVAALLGNGNGTFAAATSVALSSQPYALVTGDFNDDGKTDLAVSNTVSGVMPLIGGGNGTFTVGATIRAGLGALDLVTGDFDGDGEADLLTTNNNANGSGGIAQLLGTGTGTFGVTATVLSGNVTVAAAAADFNGDGKPDVVTANSNNDTLTLFLNRRPDAAGVTAAGGVLSHKPGPGPTLVSETAGVLTITTASGTDRRLITNLTGVTVLSGANVTFNSDLGRSGGSAELAVSVAANGSATFATSQHLAALSVSGTAAMAAGRRLLRTNTLNVPSYGRLNLNDSDLILDYAAASPIAVVRGLLASGRQTGGWAGDGISSSAGATSRTTTFAYAEASEYAAIYGPSATFHGEAVDATAVLIQYTTYGDSTFDGKTDFNDFLRLQNNFGRPGTFASGDTNFDGKIDFNDFLTLQNGFGTAVEASPAPRRYNVRR